MRTVLNLNQGWELRKNAADLAALSAVSPEMVTLPHTWNAQDGQDGGNDYFRGTCA